MCFSLNLKLLVMDGLLFSAFSHSLIVVDSSCILTDIVMSKLGILVLIQPYMDIWTILFYFMMNLLHLICEHSIYSFTCVFMLIRFSSLSYLLLMDGSFHS